MAVNFAVPDGGSFHFRRDFAGIEFAPA